MNAEKQPFGGKNDPLYDDAVNLVREENKISVSTLQRRLKIGYNRAAYMLEDMVGEVITEFSPTGKLISH